MIERRTLAMIAAVAVGLGLIGGGGWLREPVARTGVHAAVPGQAESGRRHIVPTDSTQPQPVKGNPETLAPAGMPVTQIVEALQARADAGDGRAACRLGIELLRCQLLEQAKMIQWADGLPPDVSIARQGNPEGADRFAEMEIRKIRLGQQCDAVDPDLVSRAGHYLLTAARAGEPEAMLRYAAGAHHGIAGQMGFIRDPGFEDWRRDAPAMLLRAAQAGRMDAVGLLDLAYRSDFAPYAGLVPDDPVQARAWARLDARLQGRDPPDRETDDADLERQAEALARQWHRRYFKDAVLGDDKSALSLWPLEMPVKPTEQERFCE